MTNTSKEWLEKAISDGHINNHDYDQFTNPITIGNGAFGEVFKYEWKDCDLTVALKCLKVDDELNLDKKVIEIKELRLLRKVDFHQNIIKFYGVTKDNHGFYNMILQYANDGNLQEYLKANFTKLQWIDKLHISKEIVHGLLFLHNHNIIHRDLHSKNILIHQGQPKIADFGLSKQINETSMTSNSIVRGMPAYVEPQCLLNLEYQRDKRSDVYSAGVILWEISSGKPPFQHLPPEMVVIYIFQGKREEYIEGTPFQYAELYKKCWGTDPGNRPETKLILNTIKQLIHNETLNQHESFVDLNKALTVRLNNLIALNNPLSMTSTGNQNEILEHELLYNIQNDNEFYVNICQQLKKQIDFWQQDEAKLISTCDKILNLYTKFTEFDNKNIILNNELITIIKLLEICTVIDTNILIKLLKTINLLIENNLGTLENFCLLGGIPIVINFASKFYNYETRVKSAIIIQQICDISSRLPFEKFIDCGGLESLVEPLQEDYDTHKELILIMMNGISKVLNVQNISVKEKLCKMLDNIENLDSLAITLQNIISDKNLEIGIYTGRIMNVLSEGKLIKTIMSNTSLTTKILKENTISLNNLNASQEVIIIKILIVMLDIQKQRDINSISYKIFIIIFSMCQYNKTLQETAAKAGIVTHLIYFAKHQNFNKIALMMLFKIASAGRICEDLLWENYHEILGIYFSLLDKQEYQVSALEAISKWLQEKTSEVEQIIILPENINLISKAMDTTKENSIGNVLNSLHKIIQSSLHVSYSLAHEHFFKSLLHLSEQHHDFAIRFKLLKILRSLCDVKSQLKAIEKMSGVEAIENMSGIDSLLQVKELAKEILFQQYFSKEHFNQNIIEKYCLTKGLIINIREILETAFSVFNFKINPTINILENTQRDIKVFFCTKRKASFLLDNNIDILSFQSERSKWFTVEYGINKPTMNPLIDNSSTNDVYLEIQYPQAEIGFEKENIQPSEELENAVKNALNNQDPHHQLMKVFDGAYYIGDKLTLWEDHIKQHNLDSTYLISNDGNLVQRDGLEKWIASCFEYPHKSLKIIKKSNLTPLYEIFNEPTIQNIQSVLGISDRCGGQLTTHEINERVLMTGVLQIRKPIKYYRINFDTHLKSHDYKVFGNVVNEKHQLIESLVVNFDSENKSGFSIMIESSEDAIKVDWSKLQFNWILVGKPEIGFYSVNTRNIRILHKGITQFTPSDEFISLKGLENLPSSSILVISYPSYTLFDTEPFFIAKIQNYNNNDFKLNIINYYPPDFDENYELYDSDESDIMDLNWFVISESHESIKADIVSESHEVKFINLSSIGLRNHKNESKLSYLLWLELELKS
ncbi:hypothetical protein C2G38_2152735 [Gigaspora rosea]|uniref:Protein kinase domain-containing protein n=1 Tax=Gigaspora rosea TaxID=44941 RepID=A0A397W6V4_9GLOM|nr:hypothetical protein C2G38_2152735 [Gigaspora rosea]